MLPGEAAIVDTPVNFPYGCTVCQNQKGKLVDTTVERPTAGGIYREYICFRCLKAMLVMAGFGKGEEMDRLEHAAETLEEAEKMVVGQQERILALEAQVGSQRSEIEGQRDELERLRAIAEQRQQLAEQIRNQASELVGV